MAVTEKCRSCNVELPNGPTQTFSYEDVGDPNDISTYRVVTLPLCELPECLAYIEAQQAKIEHYKTCSSQDDLRDPVCGECRKVNDKETAAKNARTAAVARRKAANEAGLPCIFDCDEDEHCTHPRATN